jgi:uncharacterized protein (DUF1501 family)
MKPNTLARRQFLRQSAATAAMGTSGAWLANLSAITQATAQSTAATDYKALVCIFLAGGNDAHNTVIPTDTTSWRCYTGTRDPKVLAQLNGVSVPANTTSIALDQASLLKIGHLNAKGLNTGRTFALHPQLKRIQALYTQSSAAIIANIGPLVQPTTKFDLMDSTFEVPSKLYSHNDQSSTWQSFGPEGMTGGWGGLMMDRLVSRNTNPTFSAIGLNTPSVWLNGQKVMPYLLGTGGFHVMGGDTGAVFGSTALFKAVRNAAATSSRPDAIVADYKRTANRALDSEAALSQNLPASPLAPWGTPGTTSATDPLLKYTEPSDSKTYLNPLAAQLQVVARMIAARNGSAIGARRQVFMVTLGGFDTHSAQLTQHASLLAKLDHAVDYFQKCLTQMPGGDMRSQVTTFTASEFGRTLTNNGDGTDHGWGGHHFVVGGAVKGGEVYGKYPQFMAFDGDGGFFSDQLLRGGALLPGQSVDQLVYTLGKWMGVAEVDLVGTTPGAGIAPHIGNFDAVDRDIGFMV